MSSTCPGCLPQPGGRGDEHGHPRAPTADGEVGREKGNGGGCSPPPPPLPARQQPPWGGFHPPARREGKGPGSPPPAGSQRRSERPDLSGTGPVFSTLPRKWKLQVFEAAARLQARRRSGSRELPGPPGGRRCGQPARRGAERSSLPGALRRASRLGAAVSVGSSRPDANARGRGGDAPGPAARSAVSVSPRPAPRSAAKRAQGEPPPPPRTDPWDAHGPGGGGGQGGAEQRRSVPDPLRH